MAHDGFSLDDKRLPIAENDIPDILACWHNRHNPDFQAERLTKLDQLKTELAPLKADRLDHLAEINRLTFESVIAPEENQTESVSASVPPQKPPEEVQQLSLPLDEREPVSALDVAKTELTELEAKIAPLQAQIDRLTRQFWVMKEVVVANNYDLSASRYRQVEQDEAYYEKPEVTMERLLILERVMGDQVRELEELSK